MVRKYGWNKMEMICASRFSIRMILMSVISNLSKHKSACAAGSNANRSTIPFAVWLPGY